MPLAADELKAALVDTLDPKVHDDIFLLRYVLSYKSFESAKAHIVAGIEYRKEHPYLELEKQGKMHPAAERIRCDFAKRARQQAADVVFAIGSSRAPATTASRRTAAPCRSFAPE